MRRRFDLEPLLYTILAATALLPVVSCGGSSTEDLGDGTGGTGTSSQSLGVCDNPIATDSSGWVRCSNTYSFAHREVAGTCDPYVPRPGDYYGCNDADCAGMLYGHCWSTSIGLAGVAQCIPGCVEDSDCAAGEICFCEQPVGRCIPADCTVDADCGANAFCSTYVGPETSACTYYIAGAACQKTGDTCTGDSCNCAMVGGDRQCVQGLGGCGRPFLVDGVERRALATSRGDWASRSRVPEHLAELSPSVRARLAEHWALAGLLEHASIAAFARFSLELLALGAPPDLVADATRAMADETRHATACFGMASAYGAKVGPGPLPVGDCLSVPTLESVVKTVLLEGCIGETIAAAEARELARIASDPVVAETLELISSDEARHSALAYRFVRWALERGDLALRELVRETLARELGKARLAAPAPELDDEAGLLALGLPTAAFRASLRRDVLERVVGPCLETLLESEHHAQVS
jgi:hypothetical protein